MASSCKHGNDHRVSTNVGSLLIIEATDSFSRILPHEVTYIDDETSRFGSQAFFPNVLFAWFDSFLLLYWCHSHLFCNVFILHSVSCDCFEETHFCRHLIVKSLKKFLKLGINISVRLLQMTRRITG